MALPEGMQASPAAADGLAACSAGGVGFKGCSNDTAQPENSSTKKSVNAVRRSARTASKIGTVNIKTPLLENELRARCTSPHRTQTRSTRRSSLYIDRRRTQPPDVLRQARRRSELNPKTGQLISDVPEHAAAAVRKLEAAPVQRPTRLAGDARATAALRREGDVHAVVRRSRRCSESRDRHSTITSEPGGQPVPGLRPAAVRAELPGRHHEHPGRRVHTVHADASTDPTATQR